MVTLPAKLGYGTIRGQIVSAIQDGPDVDEAPDLVVPTGTVRFIPEIAYAKVIPDETMTRGLLIVPKTVEVALDSEGRVTVVLLSTDDPDLGITDWTWRIEFNIPGANIEAFSTPLPTGTTLDIATIMPAPPSEGTVIDEGTQWAVNVTAQFQDLTARIIDLEAGGGGGGGGTMIHGELLELGDDDHPQYLNVGRANLWGDARYYTQAQMDAMMPNDLSELTDTTGILAGKQPLGDYATIINGLNVVDGEVTIGIDDIANLRSLLNLRVTRFWYNDTTKAWPARGGVPVGFAEWFSTKTSTSTGGPAGGAIQPPPEIADGEEWVRKPAAVL